MWGRRRDHLRERVPSSVCVLRMARGRCRVVAGLASPVAVAFVAPLVRVNRVMLTGKQKSSLVSAIQHSQDRLFIIEGPGVYDVTPENAPELFDQWQRVRQAQRDLDDATDKAATIIWAFNEEG